MAIGGRLSRLADLRVRKPALVWVALALQLVTYLDPPNDLVGVLVLGSYALLAVFLAANVAAQRGALRVAAVLLIVGWGANLVPIALNGQRMPVSRQALVDAGFPASTSPQDVASGQFAKHVAQTSRTRAAALGDVIPLRPIRTVISIGDIVIALGLLVGVPAALRRPTLTRPAAP